MITLWFTPKGGIKVEQDGLFNINEICSLIKDFYKSRKYFFNEKENTEQERSKGYEIKVAFNSERDIDDYAQFRIDITVDASGVEKVKLKNKILDKGKLRIIFKSYINLDYKNKWAKNNISKFFNYVYYKYLIKDKINNVYFAKIAQETYEVQGSVKKSIGLFTK